MWKFTTLLVSTGTLAVTPASDPWNPRFPAANPSDPYAKVDQVSLPQIEALPSLPDDWAIINFHAKAVQLHSWLFESQTPSNNSLPSGNGIDNSRKTDDGNSSLLAPSTPVTPGSKVIWFNNTFESYYHSGTIMTAPSYLGQQFPAYSPGEGLAVIGLVYNGALLGKRAFGPGVDSNFVTIYSDRNGIVWNNPPALEDGNPDTLAVLPTFWYGLANSYLMYATMDILDLPARHQMLPRAVKSWTEAYHIMGDSFNHTGFDFKAMKALNNGVWTEGDTAGGVALLGIWAAANAQKHSYNPKGPKNIVRTERIERVDEALQLAANALSALEQHSLSPLWECVMPQGALAAARLNALNDSRFGKFNVTKFLDFSFSNGNNEYRLGWGMLNHSARWGGRDVGGLIGSLTDGGGYAFFGNGLWYLAAVSPIPLYAPEYSRMVAKWTYNLVCMVVSVVCC